MTLWWWWEGEASCTHPQIVVQYVPYTRSMLSSGMGGLLTSEYIHDGSLSSGQYNFINFLKLYGRDISVPIQVTSD